MTKVLNDNATDNRLAVEMFRPSTNVAISDETRASLLKDSPKPGGPESWVQIARKGVWKGHAAGEFEFDDNTYSEIIKNFYAHGNIVVVDFEHGAEAGDGEGGVYQQGAPAQAWITDLRVDGDALMAKFAWIPEQPGLGLVRQRAYLYTSPAVQFHSVDRATGKPIGAELVSVALTNRPFLSNMQPIAAKHKIVSEKLMADEMKVDCADELPPPDKTKTKKKKKAEPEEEETELSDDAGAAEMGGGPWGGSDDADPKKLQTEFSDDRAGTKVRDLSKKSHIEGDGQMKGLFSALDLSEGVSETVLLSAVGKLKSRGAILSTALKALGLEDSASESDLTKAIVTLSTKAGEVDGLKSEVTKLSATVAEREKQDVQDDVEFLIARGKEYEIEVNEKSRKALMAYRATDPKGFADDYKVAMDGKRKYDSPVLMSSGVTAPGGKLAPPAPRESLIGEEVANGDFERLVDEHIANSKKSGIELSRNTARGAVHLSLMQSLSSK